MLKSAKSLRRQCVERVAAGLSSGDGEGCPVQASSHPVLSVALAEEVLERIAAIDDDLLLNPLFSGQLVLTRVRIEDASLVTGRGLRTLRRHRLRELRVRRLKKCSINQLIGCLGEQTLKQLRSLDVSHSLFTADAKVRHNNRTALQQH